MIRPRLTVRWLILAVALAGLALGGDRWHRRAMARRADYRSRALVHGVKEEVYGGLFRGCLRGGTIPRPDPRQADDHAAMRRKYEAATTSPWFAPPPDPPEPR
jgi:hypothetical protein